MGERNLEEEIHRILQSSSKLRKYNSMLRDKCIKQDEDFDQERKGWDRDRKKWSKKLGGVVTENQNLQFDNASKAISLANSKFEIDIKSKEITTLRSMIEILESKLSSAQGDVISIQNDSLKKESENLSLKSKIAELDHIKSSLESKVNELERLKSEAMSKPIVGGNDEKNITKSDDISAVLQSRPLDNESEIRGSVSSLNHDIYVSSEESLIRGYASPSKDLSKYFVRGKNDTKINPKVSDSRSENASASETSINEIRENITPQSQGSKSHCSAIEIPNMTPHLSQPENYGQSPVSLTHTPSLIESHSQISVGGIEAIPATARTLMSLLSAYMLLALLIIAVVCFVRHTWRFERKSDRLRDAWTRY